MYETMCGLTGWLCVSVGTPPVTMAQPAGDWGDDTITLLNTFQYSTTSL